MSISDWSSDVCSSDLLYEIAVAQIFFAIGIGKLHRFPDDMPAFRIVLSELRHIEAFDHGQNLQHGNSAGGGRPHAADGIDAIMATAGRAFLRLIRGQILRCHDGRIARRACESSPDLFGIVNSEAHTSE